MLFSKKGNKSKTLSSTSNDNGGSIGTSSASSTSIIVGRNDSKLMKLVVKQKWSDLLTLLKRDGEAALSGSHHGTRTTTGTSSIHIIYEGSEYRNGNILHIICMYHPPHKVVHYVASLCPLLTIQVNSSKQTPLHVAAAYGANHRVIQSLLRHSGAGASVAASQQDLKGRTPLHLHLKYCSSPTTANCDMGNEEESSSQQQQSLLSSNVGYCSTGGYKRIVVTSTANKQKNKKSSSPSVKLVPGPNVKVLRLLSEAAPQCIYMEDFDGITPMSIANSSSEQQTRQDSANHNNAASRLLDSRILTALQRTADAAAVAISSSSAGRRGSFIGSSSASCRHLMGGGGGRRASIESNTTGHTSSSDDPTTAISSSKRSSFTKAIRRLSGSGGSGGDSDNHHVNNNTETGFNDEPLAINKSNNGIPTRPGLVCSSISSHRTSMTVASDVDVAE